MGENEKESEESGVVGPTNETNGAGGHVRCEIIGVQGSMGGLVTWLTRHLGMSSDQGTYVGREV